MRELMASRPFVPIVLCLTIVFLMPPSAATQTAPQSSAADPTALQERRPLPEALVKALREPDVSFFIPGTQTDMLSRAFLRRKVRALFPSGRLTSTLKDADVILAIAFGPPARGAWSPGTRSSEIRHERTGVNVSDAAGWSATVVSVETRAAPAFPPPRTLIISAFVAGSPKEAVELFRGLETSNGLSVAFDRLAAMK